MGRTRHLGWQVVCMVLLFSCSANDSALKDGYFTAEAAEFDEYGWKEYITICVSGGHIIMVEYNAFNPSGFVKSWDMNYMREMNHFDGTYPNEYTRFYARQFMARQGTEGIDQLSGATHSYHTFIALADAVLENARLGDAETRLVRFDGDDAAASDGESDKGGD